MQGAYVAPHTARERRLAALFGELLGTERVGLDDDFFRLGGHSLLATQLITRIRAEFGAALSLPAVFEHPTVRAIDQVITSNHDGRLPALRTVDRLGELPLSYAQERMWFLHQLEPTCPSYNVPAAIRIRGSLDVARLREAVHAVGLRHEVLRTHFTERDGRPLAMVGEQPRITVDVVAPLSNTEERERIALAEASALALEPFDLEIGPLMRMVVTRLSDTEHVLALSMHHIVSDGWSLGVLLNELLVAYAGLPLTPLPAQYVDFAAWQREWLASGIMQDQLEYWVSALRQAPSVLDLPTDHPRPAVPSYRGAHLRARLEPQTVERLTDIARDAGTTLFSSLYAVFAALLTWRSGQDEVVIGVPVANRSRLEIEGLIGFFVNTLPLRTRVRSDCTFAELVADVGSTTLGALEHQDVPFERLVEELAPERHLARNPIFQAMFALQNMPQRITSAGEIEIEWLPLEEGTAKFDLTMLIEEEPATTVVLEYPTDLFAATTAEMMLEEYVRLCRLAATCPSATVSELTAVSPPDRARLLVELNDTYRADRLYGVVERIRQLAETRSDAVAVVDDDCALTYRQLACRAARVSRRLVGQGVAPDDTVLFLGDRGASAIAAVLGVLGAGAAFVPLDVRVPVRRTALMAADSGARVLLAGPSHVALARDVVAAAGRDIEISVLDVSSDAPDDLFPLRETAGDLAYVIYTSGSTGRPKGAMVRRLGMNNHVLAQIEALGLTGWDVVMQNASLTFDVSMWQMLTALVVGGRTRVCGDDLAMDAVRLFELTEAESVTVMEVVPSLLRAALDAWDALGTEPALPELRWLMVTGEAVPSDLAVRWMTRYPRIALVNAYGPAECSDDVTLAVITADEPVGEGRMPIGRPIRNTRLYVLDERLEPLPLGVPGELYIGGLGVGRGYLGDPARTADAFLPDPFAGEDGARLYRTGDLVRYRPDGQLEFVGRRDHQVKIRGQRIELGEIEACLRGLDGVTDAVVVVDHDLSRQSRLVGYVVGSTEPRVARAELARWLPAVMVPSVIVLLDAVPLSANGKVDRAALPPAGLDEAADYIAPRTETERLVVGLYSDVLGGARVGLDDDFFALGGHSLLATRLIARIRARFDINLPLRALFERPTPRVMAEAVEAARHDAPLPSRQLPRAHRDATGTRPRWFVSARSAPDARTQLFCIPPAGAGASAFREWGWRLAPGIEVVAVQLAGREDRFSEPAAASVTTIVRELTEPLLTRADRPFALFGHSMGALVAFELARQLAELGQPPAHLFVSGLRPPHLPAPAEVQAHLLSNDELAAYVTGLRGISLEMPASSELLRLLLPRLRADIAVCETYRFVERRPLVVPVTALAGRQDPTVSVADMARWSDLTSVPLVLREFPGGHFYVKTEMDALLSVIADTLVDSQRGATVRVRRVGG